jgi:hypothetical protein
MKRYVRRATLACAAAVFVTVSPRPVFAQDDKWEVDIAPLYLWAATTNGNIAINGIANIPVYLDFKDAASNLSGAFTFHGEVRKGQWGFLADVNFIRLSTDVNYTTPILALSIAGTIKLDQTYFDGKVMYEVKPGSKFYLAAGIRALTMAPAVHFTGPTGGRLVDIDVSKTGVAAVGGFMYRPKLHEKVVLLTRADIGGGAAFTWSAAGGIEYLIKPWVGLAAGYQVLHIDTGNVPTSGPGPITDVQYTVNQYGPAFSLTFHWAQK